MGNKPLTLAELEANALNVRSIAQTRANVKRATLLHRTEEAREECYQAVMTDMAEKVAREDLEKYLHLTDGFGLPQWANWRGDSFPVGVDFRLCVPGHTGITCTVQLQKLYGYSIEVLSYGNFFAAGNPHSYLGEALVTARRDWLYKQKVYTEYRQSQEETARFYNGGDRPTDITEETDEVEIPF